MARALHVRLDQGSADALRVIRDGGLSDSEAVRLALRETADRRRSRAGLRAEAERLAADPVDLTEAQALLDDMAAAAPDDDWP